MLVAAAGSGLPSDQRRVAGTASKFAAEHGLALARELHARLEAVAEPGDGAGDGPGEPATVGVAGPVEGAAAVAHARHEAGGVLHALLTLGRAGDVSGAARLGLARLLLGHNGPAELQG